MSSLLRLSLATLLMLLTPFYVWAQATPGYTMHQIRFPRAFETYAYAVNDHKHIVGSYIAGGGTGTGLFAKFGSAYVDLHVPREIPHDFPLPFDINHQKHVAGTVFDEFAQFLAVCRRPKWSKHATTSPFLALLATDGSKAACKISSACSKAFCCRKLRRN